MARALRGDQYKLIEYAGPSGLHTRLFDLVQDPDEKHNRVGDPEMAVLVRKMRSELIRQRDLVGDLSHPAGKAFWGVYDSHAGDPAVMSGKGVY